MLVPLAVVVVAARAAVSARRARHHGDLRAPARVQDRGAGKLLRLAPCAVALVHHERLLVPAGVGVEPARRTATRPPARHRRSQLRSRPRSACPGRAPPPPGPSAPAPPQRARSQQPALKPAPAQRPGAHHHQLPPPAPRSHQRRRTQTSRRLPATVPRPAHRHSHDHSPGTR